MSATTIAFDKAPKIRRAEHMTETGAGPGHKSARSTMADLPYEPAAGEGMRSLAPIDISQLYAAPGVISPAFVRALDLLTEAIAMVGNARVNEAAGRPVDADSEIVKFQLLLHDLFSCRSVGDGLGTIINSLQFAFINQTGKPLTEPQIAALWRVLRELKSHPFLSLESALDQIDELTRVGFLVDPPILADLLPITNDEGLH